MIRELDTRTIFGNGGHVVWDFDSDANHLVTVKDCHGETVVVLAELTPAEAAVAFWHTFADPRVPNIFGGAPATLLADSSEDDDDMIPTPFGPIPRAQFEEAA